MKTTVTISCLGLVCLTTLFSLQLQAQTPPRPATAISELKGAELYADMIGKGQVKIFLKAWYPCAASVPVNEHLSLFESMGNRLVQVLELKQDTVVLQPDKSAPSCFTEKETCLKQVTWSVKTDLGLAHMDYDLSWGYCFFDRSITNLDPGSRQGFALVLNLPNPAMVLPNVSASLKQLPAHHLCHNTSVSFACTLNNPDSDEVTLQLARPFHFTVTGKTTYNYTAGKTANLDQVMQNLAFSGSFLTNHPPFEPVQYAADRSAEKPFATGELKFGNRKLEIRSAPQGRYLLAFTLQEKRSDKTTATHTAVFITEIH